MKVRVIILSESEYDLVLDTLTAATSSRSVPTATRAKEALRAITDAAFISNVDEAVKGKVVK